MDLYGFLISKTTCCTHDITFLLIIMIKACVRFFLLS